MKKLVKTAIALIIVLILLFIDTSNIFAVSQSMIDGATSEGGDKPVPSGSPEPSPPGAPSTPTVVEKQGDVYQRITYYNSISGNAYEDLGIMRSGINKDGSKVSDCSDAYNYPISGIKVQLMQNGNPCGDAKWVESDGSYFFKPSQAGNYSVRFTYGDVSGADMSNTTLIKNILQYNGQDYIAKSVGSNRDYTIETKTRGEWEIQLSKKGAAQVNIVMDCSISMLDTTVEVNGKKKTRIQIEAEAAEKLIDELLDCGENIYVGLIVFSGEARRVVSLTKNKEVLKDALKIIKQPRFWRVANTDMVYALNKANESFYFKEGSEDQSNRTVILLSDGIPTKNGNEKIYRDDSDSDVERKLNSIKIATKAKVEELRNKGIKIFSLFTTSQDEEENKWVKEIFENPSNEKEFLSVQDGQEVIHAITKDIKDYCIINTGEAEYTETSTITVIAGKENEARRKEIDDYFANNNFYYANTSIFNIIDTYNGSADSINTANELSQKTLMYADTGTYAIETSKSNYSYTQTAYETTADGEQIPYTQTVHVIYVPTSYSGVNLVLQQRPTLSLKTTVTATAIKVTLSNEQVLYNEFRNLGDTIPLVEYMDDELAHGSTVEVEYTISVKNDSPIQCEYLELINILPDCFRYSASAQLLTENRTNSDCGWRSVDLRELKDNGYVSKEVSTVYANKEAMKIVLDNNGQGRNGFYLPSGGEYILKFVTSTILSEAATLKDGYNDIVEVLAYNNSSHRRMADAKPVEVLDSSRTHVGYVQKLIGIYPGNGIEKDCSRSTNEVIVIPPTGINMSKQVLRAILINAVVIISAILIIIALLLFKTRKELHKK